MQNYHHNTIPHKKICLALFLVFCLILTVFYYSNACLEYKLSFPYQDYVYSDRNNSESTRSNIIILNTTITKINNNTWKDTNIISNVSIATSKPDAKWSDQTLEIKAKDIKFLVSSSKCKMIDLDPFNVDAKRFFHPEPYKSCRKLELLTYVTKLDNTSVLHIDNDVAPSYSTSGVKCCYSEVLRPNMSDSGVTLTDCVPFENNVTFHHNAVMVKCNVKGKKSQFYENVHVSITPTETVLQKMQNYENSNGTKPISVLFVGIDSISRLNLIRSLPVTYKFLENNNWIGLKGYNKMDDNTFPNLMAILTGYNQSYAYNICNPKAEGKLDNCSMLWYDYRQLGYITGYAEDQASINTFNYLKKGFQIPPTDYYLRPYIIATEKLKKVSKDGMDYCTGPETAGERIMNVAKDFSITFKNYPTFGFFWMNSFSHNKLNSPSGMDGKVKNFLEDLTTSGVTNDSVIIFLSDHGLRFGDIRLTETGWLEERLPFVYISIPKWFQEKFPLEYENLRNNTNKLTCPYDVHMTLKHILVLSGFNYTITPGDACPLCKSLFEPAESERSCQDAGITQHWCTCMGFKSTNLEESVKSSITNYILNEISKIIKERKGDQHCAKFSVKQVMDVRISENLPFLLIRLKTEPEAVFETTVSFRGDISNKNFSLSGDISRIDSYKKSSECVSDAYLKKYCYCH